MFSNSYQSGNYIELFNSQNKELVKNWKLTGKLSKEYDSSVKGYVHMLNSGGVSKMQIPSNDKNHLGIVQSYIVFQIYVFSPKSFSIEIAISDTSKTKRRLMFSTSSKDVVINPLHCRIPLVEVPIGTWLNISIDVLSFVADCFKTETFRSIDFISVSANCKIRRIFSMRNSLMELEKNLNEEFPLEYAEILPKNLALPSTIAHENINLNIEKIKLQIETEFKSSKDLSNVNSTNVLSPQFNKNGSAKFQTQLKKPNVKATVNLSNTPTQIRSKSQTRPLKQEKELKNKQEFLIKEKINSKSPGPEAFGEDSDLINIIKNRVKMNKENIKINPRNFIKSINKEHNQKALSRPIKINPTPSKSNAKSHYNFNKSNKSPSKYNPIEHMNIQGKDDNLILLNTLNYKNMGKWENSKDNMADSIEEIYDIEDKKTIEREVLDDKNMMNEESDDKFYYDIPIKDYKKKSQYKESGNFFASKTKMNVMPQNDENATNLDTKRQIIAEILKESHNTFKLIDKERPFTPPFTKLVPMNSLKSLDKANSLLDKIQEEPVNDNNPYKINSGNDLDLIYDHVLGCYYDPKTNMYYELKNN